MTIAIQVVKYVLFAALTLVCIAISIVPGAGISWGISQLPLPPWWIWPFCIAACVLGPIFVGLRGFGELLMWGGLILLFSILLAMSLVSENYQLG